MFPIVKLQLTKLINSDRQWWHISVARAYVSSRRLIFDPIFCMKPQNIFQISILCVVYIPSFRFLAPKLGVQPSKRGNFTPKILRYGGRGPGGGKYFSNLYPMCSLYSKFQFPSTKIRGPALKKGQFYPQNPSLRGGGGRGGGGNIFQIYIQNEAYILSFSCLAP